MKVLGPCTSIPMSAWIAACKLICRVGAIYYEIDLSEDEPQPRGQCRVLHRNMPGRDGPLGSPGGATKLGPGGVDTPLVAALPPQAPALRRPNDVVGWEP